MRLLLALLPFLSLAIAAERSCESYLTKISNWPDGYRGILNLPVLEQMHGWNIKITFTHNVRNFDTAYGDVRRTSMQEYNIKNRPHNGNLRSPGTFRFDFTIHHDRSTKQWLRIKSIQFGSFSCGMGGNPTTIAPTTIAPTTNIPTTNAPTTNPPTTTTTEQAILPTCEEFITVIQTKPTSELFDLRLPIIESSKGWLLNVGWTKPAKCFLFKGPVYITHKQMQEFQFKSRFPEPLEVQTMFVRRFNATFMDTDRPFINHIKLGKFECRGYNPSN
eukprot:TCONS_00071202-protein